MSKARREFIKRLIDYYDQRDWDWSKAVEFLTSYWNLNSV